MSISTERNALLQEIIRLCEDTRHIEFLLSLSTDHTVDVMERNKELKRDVLLLKNERDWMFNKILERVNR